MIDRLLDFLTGRAAPVLSGNASELQHAVAALLIEAARMDDTFNTDERQTIERLLAKRFTLEPQAVRSLIETAEGEHSTQYFPFTQVCARLSAEERVDIIEMMWEVVYSDGNLDPYEDMLLRRIAGLIHVTDVDRGLARQRALEGLAAERKTN